MRRGQTNATENSYEFDGDKLEQFPVPAESPADHREADRSSWRSVGKASNRRAYCRRCLRPVKSWTAVAHLADKR